MPLNRLNGGIYISFRCAHTASNAYPFPASHNPTPHQIFHLPVGATQDQIKARYKDLVRVYHPDCARVHHPTVSRDVCTRRFQAITAAYDVLKGRTTSRFAAHNSHDWTYEKELLRRRQQQAYSERMRQERRREEAYAWVTDEEQRWKHTSMIVFGILALVVGIAPTVFILPWHLAKQHSNAAKSLSDARTDAKNEGHIRREALQRRLEQIKAEKQL